jgi:hypothetical protein
LDALPLNPNGKLDRAALRADDGRAGWAGGDYASAVSRWMAPTWGIGIVAGRTLGEVVAVHAAGVLAPADAGALVIARDR